jgi:endonuclease YncB( thermonuclease family)
VSSTNALGRYSSMRRSFFILLLLVPLSAIAGERCIAIDGDTLVCNYRKVRLTNVYAAELNEPGGRLAKRRLQAIVASGEIALRAYGQDRYGRTLAEVYVNGRRIEQADIGPRAGRGARWQGERHHVRQQRSGSRIHNR